MDPNGTQPTTNNHEDERKPTLQQNDHATATCIEEEWSSSSDVEETDYEYEGFLEEGQGSNYSEGDFDDHADDDYYMEEDDIDPDEMSYEELMALGEFIGPAEKRGLSMEEIMAAGCLRRGKKYDELSGDVDRCVICQADYGEGGGDRDEELAEIVGCGHPYHEGCITNWLLVKKSCPICGYEVSPSLLLSSSNVKNSTDANADNYNGNHSVGDCNYGGGLCNRNNDD